MFSRLAALFFGLALLLGLAEPAVAGTPEAEAVIREFSDQLLGLMKDGPKLSFAARVERIRPPVSKVFNMAAMTRSTLGAAANKLSPEDSAHLAETYTEYSAATYASQFDEWDGERFEVGEARPSSGGAIVVPSWIVPKTGDPTQLDYVLREDQGQWRVVDILFDGTVSQVAVRRSEFVSIYRAKGFSGLIETLVAQTKALGKN